MRISLLMALIFSCKLLVDCFAADPSLLSDLPRLKIRKGSAANVAKQLLLKRLPFSSVYYVQQMINKTEELSAEDMLLISHAAYLTSEDYFFNIKQSHLPADRGEGIDFIMGLKLAKLKQWNQALSYFGNMLIDDRNYAEGRLYMGSIYYQQGKQVLARQQFSLCIQKAKERQTETDDRSLKHYYGHLQDSCQMDLARIAYHDQNMNAAVDAYDKINKRSYRWPDLLLEKAWATYQMEDYNRALGLLVTYKSPFLRDQIFFPEAEVLTALSYFRLCLWQDTFRVISHFYRSYAPWVLAWRGLLQSEGRGSDKYYRLVTDESLKPEVEKLHLATLINQLRTEVKFHLLLNRVEKINYEISKLARYRQNKQIKRLIGRLERLKKLKIKAVSRLVRNKMITLTKELTRFAFEMFNIKLEMISRQKNLIYRDETLVADRARGSLNFVKRKTNQYFWRFSGEFWADELGDYSFGLQSNCEIKSKKVAHTTRVREVASE